MLRHRRRRQARRPVAGSPSPSPAASPAADGIDHPVGATDVVLRMASGGGFTIIGWAATEAPSFTLYGDGTIVARDDLAPMPDPGPDGLMRQNPFFTAKMSEGQIQHLLRYALAEGGLGIARAQYDDRSPTSRPRHSRSTPAGCRRRSPSTPSGSTRGRPPTRAIKKAFVALADRLRGIARDLPTAAEPYVAGALAWGAPRGRGRSGRQPDGVAVADHHDRRLHRGPTGERPFPAG